MQKFFWAPALAGLMMTATGSVSSVSAQDAADVEKMTFFITSDGMGNGADLGGLEGADAHCAALAEAAGSTRTGWKAYLQHVDGHR